MNGRPDNGDEIDGWNPFATPDEQTVPPSAGGSPSQDGPRPSVPGDHAGTEAQAQPGDASGAIEPDQSFSGQFRRRSAQIRNHGERLLRSARTQVGKVTLPSDFATMWQDVSGRVWPFSLSAAGGAGGGPGPVAELLDRPTVSARVGVSVSSKTPSARHPEEPTDLVLPNGFQDLPPGEHEAVFDPHYQKALDALQSVIERAEAGKIDERLRLTDDLEDLRSIQQKLKTGRIEIVLFGEISTGKSAMINALAGRVIAEVDPRGGWTKVSKAARWEEVEYRLPGIDGSEVVLIDTPGINEVGDQEHARIARRCAERADVILFVVDSDLNEVEYAAFLELCTFHKPILLVLNKIDQYNKRDRETLQQVLRERLGDLLPPQNLVLTSAEPPEREYVLMGADGSERVELRQPPPNIVDLKVRILEILEKEGLALIAVNASMFAADRADRLASVRVRMRNLTADQVIWGFAATKAVAVAVNPVGLVDVLGGAAVDVAMIASLAKVYDLPMTWNNARKLAVSIGLAVSLVAAGEGAISLGSSMFKLFTVGWGTLLVAIPQGVAAGFGSYLVGQAAKRYFQQAGSWGNNSPKTVVQQILADIDKESVLAQLRQRIEQRLRRNPHAT